MKFLLPTSCIGCGKFQASRICQKCINLLKSQQKNRCSQCASICDETKTTCTNCQNQTSSFDKTICIDCYGGLLTNAVHDYKYKHQVAIAKGLVDTWVEIHGSHHLMSNANLLIPVPMSSQKLYQRGFNQSWELCKLFSKEFKIQTSSSILYRRHLESNQAQATRNERIKRLETVFDINQIEINMIKNNRIAIVDDVMTTGATLSTIAKLLKDFGAQSVHNWVILRTPHK
jgi:ComF family protein